MVSSKGRILSTKVDQLDRTKGLAKKAGAESSEFFSGVGGEETQVRKSGLAGVGEMPEDGMGGGFGGVDDLERIVESHQSRLDLRSEQGIMGTTEQERAGFRSDLLCLVEIDAEDLAGHGGCRRRCVEPSFFHQRNEKGTCQLGDLQAKRPDGTGVGSGLDGGGGREGQGRAPPRSRGRRRLRKQSLR